MKLNKYQTQLTDELLRGLHQEIRDELIDIINNVDYIKRLISVNRSYAKDLPRDKEDKIIVDLCNPHILEDMDYFRPTALHYKKYGALTNLRPNPNPYSEFGKWIREEIRRSWHGYVRESDGEWITGDMYFYLNYCPIIQSKTRTGTKLADRIVDFPEVWEGIYLRFHYIYQARYGGLYNDFKGGQHGAEIAKRGAAHPYSQEVYTPQGLKLWGDIQIGDELFATDGSITNVTNIPFDDECDIYTITLKDGRKVQASDNHLWKVIKANKELIISTKQLLSSYKSIRIPNSHVPSGIEYKYSIPSNKGVEFPYKETQVDPYTFGLLLGDGSFRHPCCYYTCETSDFEVISKHIPYEYTKWKGEYAYRIHVPDWQTKLKNYGLNFKKSEDKFIPDEYKFNSRKVRLEILKGLMDSDGYSNKQKVCPNITTVSSRLRDDILFICRSLGYNCSYSTSKAGYKKDGDYIECHEAYTILISTGDDLFKLPRKLANSPIFQSNYSKSRRDKTRIVNVEFSHRERAKCVTVDSKDSCYLIGDFVTTHNSKSYVVASILAKIFILGESEESHEQVRGLITAYQKEYLNRDGTLNKFVSMIDFCANHTQFPSQRIWSSLHDMQWKMGGVDLASGTIKGTQNEIIGVSSKDDVDKLRGKRSQRIFIEEYGNFPKITDIYRVIIPSVQEGDIAFGQIYLIGCVCAGTKVFNTSGKLINIEDIEQSNGIIGYNGSSYSKEDITYMQPEVYKECLRIETSKNNFIECSTDHPLLVRSRITSISKKKTTVVTFKRAKDLKVGDRLMTSNYIPIFGDKKLVNPELIGLLIGDGNYSTTANPTLSVSSNSLYDYLDSKYDFGISKVHSSKKGIYAQIYFSKSLFNQLEELGIKGQKCEDKTLPINIHEYDEASVCGLLKGYFEADGNIQLRGDQRSIKLTSKHESILKEVQALLLKVGINSAIRQETKGAEQLKSYVNGKTYKTTKFKAHVLYITDSYYISIFKDKIGFLSTEKQERLDSFKLKGRQSNIYQNGCIFEMSDNGKGEYFKSIPRLYNLEGVKVTSIQNLGERRVYNLTANTTHTYITNGFISSNTGGSEGADFAGAQEMIYGGKGYNIYMLPNFYDKNSQGKNYSIYFFGAYMNKKECYNKDGVSDVTKALIELLQGRYDIKYNSTNPMAITRTKAENPITIQEAIMRKEGTIFPVADLTERLNEIDFNLDEYNDVYTGELVIKNGQVEFNPSSAAPIREFPLKDNRSDGCVEIYKMPEKNRQGKVFSNRYIAGTDPKHSMGLIVVIL